MKNSLKFNLTTRGFFRILMSVFFLVAGINHFISPEAYLPLIPPYLPYPEFLNLFSGVLEVIFGAGLLSKSYRKWSAYGIMILMVLFIPAHVHHIYMDGCVSDDICIPLWAAWVRLLVIQPLIILWAYFCRK